MEDFGFGWFAFGWFIACFFGWSMGRHENPKPLSTSDFGGAIIVAWAIVGVLSWLMPIWGKI